MKRLLCLFLTIMAIPALAQGFSLRPDAPEKYIVRPGDNLWDIASRYLTHPWQWPDLLNANPQIKNPKKLYPGATLYLHRAHDNAYMTILGNGAVKLSPKARPVPITKPIPPIPLADIKPFFNGSIVLDEDVMKQAPYIVAYAGEHLVGGQGNLVYVKDLERLPTQFKAFTVYRPDGYYTDPNTDEFLGFKSLLIGHAQLIKPGPPATLLLNDITQGVHLKDKVLPDDYPPYELYFLPHAPSIKIQAKIIDLIGGLNQLAKGQVIVINQGVDSGLTPGDVLAIHQLGKIIKDPLNDEQLIELPQERIGEVLLYRVFTKTSIGLIMRSTRAIRLYDTVTNP